MTIQQLHGAIRAQPFRPFVIHLADGRKVPVTHPESIAINPSGRTTVVVRPDDGWNVVDLLLVTDLDFGESDSRLTA